MKLPLKAEDWSLSKRLENYRIYDSERVMLAELLDKEDAAFIVKAVNNHYQLLEGLKDLMASIGGGAKSCGHEFTCNCAWENAKETIKQIESEA